MKKMFQENGYIFWERPEREGIKKASRMGTLFLILKMNYSFRVNLTKPVTVKSLSVLSR